MAFDYGEVVPWGRSYEEYLRMFALSESDLARPLLGCADGPASFNAGMTRLGHRVISVDPLYRHAAREVRVFPLVDVNAETSAYLDPMLAELARAGIGVEVRSVPYKFQRGTNQMLRIRCAPRG